MKETLSNQEENGYLFNVDILIKGRSNALALQSLLEFMNKEKQVADFRIQSGIELGKIIEAVEQSNKDTVDSVRHIQDQVQVSTGKQATTAAQVKASIDQAKQRVANTLDKKNTTPNTSHVADANSFDSWINSLIKENRLMRIVVNNKNGKHQSIPCRILNFDRDISVITIYHVDEKQVYTFSTNEIDEFL